MQKNGERQKKKRTSSTNRKQFQIQLMLQSNYTPIKINLKNPTKSINTLNVNVNAQNKRQETNRVD